MMIDKMNHWVRRVGTVLRFYSLLLSCCLLVSCSLDIPYENQFSDPTAITTTETARELLASAYYELPASEFDLSVLGDDFETTYLVGRNSTLNDLYRWQPQPMKDLGQTLWTSYYSVVAIVNALMERVDDVSVSTDVERKELQAIVSEANILKAYCYFNLLRLFAPTYADGPDEDGIILKDELRLEFLKRSTVDECVATIRNLLTEAVKVENNPDDEYWLSQCSGYYLLAELELYAQNYSSAEAYAQKVIDLKGGYDVLESGEYANLFTNTACEERIFSRYSSTTYYSDINYDKEKGDYMVVNDALVSAFSKGDIRYDEAVYPFDMPTETAGTVESVDYLGKYAKRTNWMSEEVNYISKMRISGACFILAEAYYRDGNEERTIQVMNDYLIRRESVTLSETLSGEQLLKAIFMEKWKEFVGEGERYFDLKRCRKEILSDWNSDMRDKNVSADDYRWNFPLPTGEYLYNENVHQNKGWEEIEMD